MKNCPTCGVALDARLVDAIINPSMDASCPKARTPEPKKAQGGKPTPLATLIMLGTLAGGLK